MANSNALPKLTAPPFRETTNRKTWTEYLRGDIKQVADQAAAWVQAKTIEEIKRQHELGNSKQFTAVVDGSTTKAIERAERRVVVYFVSAILTRTLGRAKEVLQHNILRFTRNHPDLVEGWTWFLRTGGKAGTIKAIGQTLPTNIRLNAGDALILAPTTKYAWFVNSAAVRHDVSKKIDRRAREDARFKATGKRRGGRALSATPGGKGFMAATSAQLRADLKRVGFTVWASTTFRAPPGPSAGWRSTKRGVPILIFRAGRSVNAQRG